MFRPCVYIYIYYDFIHLPSKLPKCRYVYIYMCTCDHIIHFMNQHNKLNVAWGQEMGLGSQGQDDEESER